MPLAINANVASLNTQRALSGSVSLLQTALQRLPVGSGINSAKDDAAGCSGSVAARLTGCEMAGERC